MYHDFNYVGYEQRRQKPQQRKPRYSVNHAAVGDDSKLYRSISIEANMNDQVTADTHKASKKDNHVGRHKKFESIQLKSSRRPKSLESQDLFFLHGAKYRKKNRICSFAFLESPSNSTKLGS